MTTAALIDLPLEAQRNGRDVLTGNDRNSPVIELPMSEVRREPCRDRPLVFASAQSIICNNIRINGIAGSLWAI